jgi:rhodanese-related sulfurtransferase
MKTLVAILGLFLAAVALPRPARAAPEEGVAEVKPGKVDGPTAKALAAAGARLVDVRTPEEFASGHVPGAINIPHDELPRRAAEIGPPSAKVVLYCGTGRRSAIAMEALQKAGYASVYDLGSASAWPGELVR